MDGSSRMSDIGGGLMPEERLITQPERWSRSRLLTLACLALANAGEAVEALSAGIIMQRATSNVAVQTTIAAAVFVGMLLGGLLSGAAADAFGRAKVLRTALLLATIAAAAAAASPNAIILVCCRLLAGTGVGAATPPLFALASEVAPHGRSGPAIVAVASAWTAGQMATAGLALLILGEAGEEAPPTWDWDARWRTFALVASLVPASATGAAYCIVRDPRAVNGSPVLRTANARPLRALRGVYVNMLRSAAGMLLPLAVVWFGLNFGYYGMSTWVTVLLINSGVKGAYYVSLLYAAAQLPANLGAMVLVDKMGRRPLLVFAIGLTGASALGVGGLIYWGGRRELLILSICSFGAFSTAGWNALNCLSAEGFHASVRATAFGLLTVTGRVGSIVAQVVNGSLSHHVTVLLLVTTACLVVSCVGALSIPTSNVAVKDHERDDSSGSSPVSERSAEGDTRESRVS